MIVGIDLAGVQKNPSGFCVLDPETLRVKTFLLFSDKEIIEEVKRIKPKIIAIDAPLSLPPGRKSIDELTGVHLREADKQLLKRGIKFFPITIGPMRELTKRGMRLKKSLERAGLKVIEVYPGGAQDVLGMSRKKDPKKLKDSLRKFGIKGLKKKISDHELDAVTCALVGKYFLNGKAEILGTLKSGIVMPKQLFIFS